MRKTVVVLGAGHAGLAMSRCLTDRSVDHVVLERGEVANSWRRERWDSLRLLTPNWQTRLPGHAYSGVNPGGYRTMDETVRMLQDYARSNQAPVHTHTRALSVRSLGPGYSVVTNQGSWSCDAVVIATGACNVPNVPSVAQGIPREVRQLTPFQYGNPDQIADGGVLVVGASATGVQIAEEVKRSGREVTLSVGEHVRVPRMYRGRDIQWWMDAAGVFADSYKEVENLDRARSLPSLQLAGTLDGRSVDLNAMTDLGVRLAGRLAGIQDGRAQFSGSLPNMAALADLKMNRLLDRIDEWASESGVADRVVASYRFEPTRLEASPPLGVDLTDGRIRTVIWATGFRPDYSWLDVPVLDRKGRLRHDGGVVDAPGLYVMGLPFMRTRRSSLIDGAGEDARVLCDHLVSGLDTTH
ncbi:MAG: NAD(P)-binding domain-containing protein, partial [Longimicrobiales bacterium]